MTEQNPNQKGGQLEGGAISDEVMASSKTVHEKGLQQFYTPEPAAKLIHQVIGDMEVLDLTAGDGSLIKEFSSNRRFGVEIDPDQIQNAKDAEREYCAIRGDIQHVYTLLRNAAPEFPAIVLNPPFGLRWSDPSFKDGAEVNSTLLTMVYGKRLLAAYGQIVLIAGKNRFWREIAGHEEFKDMFYAVVECDDLFPGTREPAVIAFGFDSDCVKTTAAGSLEPQVRSISLDMLDLLVPWVRECREHAKDPYTRLAQRSYYSHAWDDAFDAIQKEYDRRTGERVKKDREFDVMLDGDKVQFLPSAYSIEALKKFDAYNEVRYLHGQSVNYFLQAERLWYKLLAHEEGGLITICPKFKTRVDFVVGEAMKELIPLYDIKPQQALGFLVDAETIKCIKDDPEFKFVKGELYRIQCRTKTIIENERRVVENKKKPGEYTTKDFKVQKKLLEIMVWGQGGHRKIYDGGDEASEQIKWLVDHFHIPNPGSVATKHPDEVKRIEDKCQVILDRFMENSQKWEKKHPSATPYSHRSFQKRDVSRLVFKGSGLLSWEQGLGKTLGGLLFAEACQEIHNAQNATLIVTAKDLVPQWTRECQRFLGKKPTLIKTHAQAKQIANHLRRGGTGLYITYYEALSIVGTRNKNNMLPTVTVREWEEKRLTKGSDRYGYFYYEDGDQSDDSRYLTRYNDEGVEVQEYRKQVMVPDGESPPEGYVKRYGYIRPQYHNITKKLTSRDLCPQCEADLRSGWNGTICEAKDEKGATCGYTHYATRMKPIASFLSTAFRRGTVILDEITLIQGQYSKRSLALRGLRSKHKLGMTGTPIKNFIGQAFWLLWWCLGNGSRRFPYEYDGGYITFENDFSVVEWAISSGRKQNRKALPEVTNLSKLWRLLASSIIRRRKEETGEDIVPIYYHEIRTPLGIAQTEQTHAWLKNFPDFFKEKYPEAPVVKAGMHKIMAPMLGLNWKLDYACTVPECDPDYEWTAVEGVSNFTPANLRVIELAMALAKSDRKVLIGSNLVTTSQWIVEQLVDKGVKAEHILDGDGTTVNPEERAKRVYSFQTDEVQVFAAGVNAIRLGHNLDAADAVILHGLDWSFDTMDQFIARVHRLTSQNPIDVFVVLPALSKQNTITTRKWSQLQMKGDAADLALDGRLVPKREQQITEAEVIRELMERGMTVTEEAVSEIDVAESWEKVLHIDQYELVDGVIPPRPVVEADPDAPEKAGWEAAEAFAGFLVAYGFDQVEPTVTQAEQEKAEEEYESEDYFVSDDTSNPTLPPSADEESVASTEEAEVESAGISDESVGSYGPDDDRTSTPTQIAQDSAQPTEASSDGDSSPDAGEPRVDIMGQIKQAAELHAAGILTDTEFAEAKTVLLTGLKTLVGGGQ